MKKIAIATILAAAAMAASAVEVGVTANHDYGNPERSGGGVTLGQHFGAVSATVGFDRTYITNNDQNRITLTGGYDVAKFGGFTVTPKVGVAYLNNQTGDNGYALTVGAGTSYAVTKSISVGLDVAHQYGQNRVSSFDGNRVTAGVTYGF